jgi:hypothetical protein
LRMSPMLKNLLLMSTTSLFLSGCMSLSSYQTADTIENNEVEWSASVAQSYVPLSGPDEDFDDGESIVTPEVSVRIGVGESTDIGIKLYAFSAVFDVKHQFVKSEKYSSAFGMGLSYVSFDSDSSFTDLYPAYYHTIYHNPQLSSTISPRVIARFYGSDDSNDDDGNVVMPGIVYTLDYKVKDSRVSLRPEIGVYKFDDYYLGHFGFGIAF